MLIGILLCNYLCSFLHLLKFNLFCQLCCLIVVSKELHLLFCFLDQVICVIIDFLVVYLLYQLVKQLQFQVKIIIRASFRSLFHGLPFLLHLYVHAHDHHRHMTLLMNWYEYVNVNLHLLSSIQSAFFLQLSFYLVMYLSFHLMVTQINHFNHLATGITQLILIQGYLALCYSCSMILSSGLPLVTVSVAVLIFINWQHLQILFKFYQNLNF